VLELEACVMDETNASYLKDRIEPEKVRKLVYEKNELFPSPAEKNKVIYGILPNPHK
jgi:hypothetical protein